MTVTELHPGAVNAPNTRWVPRRAGILNIWRYYDEVFEFHRGRLLLRGANGSGKSKALELLLPFLFDASLRAQRLSTFGTSERTMHWNLMGDGATGTTRVGYVWMEFSSDAGGPGGGSERRWFVCGARLQASAHTSSAHADYFTLHRRVADGEFTTTSAQPLTRAALVERLGADGTVHPGATEHRATVREVLFGGLSEQRYESLLLALLQLRMPKLSQRLDPSLLSSLLSRALPPLGESELAELAEGFERLDRQRETLERLDAEVAAAQRLAARQQSYACRVLRAAAARLISATSEMDGRTRTARESEDALGTAGREVDQARIRYERAERTARTTETDIEALRSRTDYQQGAAALRQLDDKRAQATHAEQAAAVARTSAGKARRQATFDVAAAATTQLREAELTGQVDELGSSGERAAERARLSTVHAEVGELALGDRNRARHLLDGAIGGRHGEIAAVRTAIGQHAAAVDRRSYAEEAVEEARETLSTALTARTSSEGALDDARRERADRLSEWAAGCRELQLDAASVNAAVDDERALDAIVAAAADRTTGELATAEATAVQRRRVVTAERDAHTAELATVRAQRHVPPPAPATRTADRATAAGAPLWQLVDFVDGLPAVDAAAVEAALQAGGLLDAWVDPTGMAVVEGHDVRADPAHLAPAPGRSLADVLRPEGNTPVPVERIRELLSVIAFGERLPTSTTSPTAHPAAVGADGSWRLGPVTGSWAKAEPEHIGATARARARERRIAALVADVERSEVALAELASELRGIAGRRALLAADQAARPDRDALDAAASVLAGAELAVVQAERDTGRWVGKLADAAEAVSTRMRELTAVAARTGLPTRADELDRLGRAVDDYRSAAGQWLDRCGQLVAAQDAAVTAGAVAGRSVEAATEREEAADQQEEIARELRRAVATLEGSIGQAYHEIADRIAALRTQCDLAREAATAARDAKHKLELLIVTLENRAAAANEAQDAAIAARDVAGARMRALGGGTLVADAGVELQFAAADGVRATLDSARAVAARWTELPHEPRQIDQALARLAEELHGARDVLGVRADLALESEGEHQVLVAVAGGVRTGAAGLLEVVRSEAHRAREDITAAERQLFDTTLTGDTRRHLADRIRQARALVDGMNERLHEVRTASRVAVQLVWQVDPDLPASAQTARELLLRNPARLSDADRDALHRFFRERVDQARATDSSQSWEQQLGEVFDYTSWHRFVVKVDRGRGEGWQLLTRKLHGALSGGEKAIALHLPLFAAVAAHYESVRQAPRLILLDEVFVGVDAVNRGQVFALLASLDLDLVLTSDHEWCAYSELDGIAVHQLVTGDDSDDAVTTARFVWTGEDWLPSDESGEP